MTWSSGTDAGGARGGEQAGEVRRVLRPAGTFVDSVLHTCDAHYGAGTAHGDDIYEHSGFAVHFFDRDLVDALADGWKLDAIHAFEESTLPRSPWLGALRLSLGRWTTSRDIETAAAAISWAAAAR